jgi:hypothetical protein
MKILIRPNDLAKQLIFLTRTSEKNLESFEQNLSGVEHLLSQSLKGFHFAFDKQDIKLALGSPLNGISEFEYENREQVQEIFFKFVKQETLDKKQAFLETLSVLDKELLIKAYFNILENALKKCSQTQH